jgi:hypothetical protein
MNMDEQRIREIVREEIAKEKEEAAAGTATPDDRKFGITQKELIGKGFDEKKFQDLN